MLISVIIATKNEERNIEACIGSVLAQKYPQDQIEIIVVDNHSTDKTAELAHKYTDKVYTVSPERSAQKNYGIEKSQSEYFLHLDADMTLSEEVIRECAEKVRSGKDIVALYIPEIISGEKFFSKVRRFERSFYDGTVVDGVRFIQKSAFNKAGGFDEKLYACEDWDLDKRLKKIGRIDIVDSPLFHNESEFDLKKYLSKKAYYSKNVDVYLKKWGKNDPDVRKQFGLFYRYFGVFTEKGKWKKIIQHPVLAAAMYFLKILVGFRYILR